MVTTERLEEMRYNELMIVQRAANENVRRVSVELADALAELISRREVDDETRRQVEYFAEHGLALTVAEEGVDPRIVESKTKAEFHTNTVPAVLPEHSGSVLIVKALHQTPQSGRAN